MVDTKNKKVEKPDGPLCFGCGVTCEVWPHEKSSTLITKYYNPGERNFKVEFDEIQEPA
jgi:hypothetical protein